MQLSEMEEQGRLIWNSFRIYPHHDPFVWETLKLWAQEIYIFWKVYGIKFAKSFFLCVNVGLRLKEFISELQIWLGENANKITELYTEITLYRIILFNSSSIYSLKKSENSCFSLVFSGYRNGVLASNEFIFFFKISKKPPYASKLF